MSERSPLFAGANPVAARLSVDFTGTAEEFVK